MQTNRGVARRDCRCAQARTRFTPRQRFAKAKLCLSIKAFHAVRIFARLHGGVRIAQQPVDFRSSLRTRGPSLDSRVRGNKRSSERSPDCATRNPGLTARLAPDFVSLNPGYACWRGHAFRCFDCAEVKLKLVDQSLRQIVHGDAAKLFCCLQQYHTPKTPPCRRRHAGATALLPGKDERPATVGTLNFA